MKSPARPGKTYGMHNGTNRKSVGSWGGFMWPMGHASATTATRWRAALVRPRADAGSRRPGSRAKHRFRFAAALEECPRLVHLWFECMPAAWIAPGRVSSDGRLCLRRNPTTIRDVATGKTVARLSTPGSINHAFFSFDGTRVATASSQHGARVWDTTTGKPLSPLFDTGVPLRFVVLSRDGSRGHGPGR